MARGYPDYFGYSMFPYYGALLDMDDTGVLAAGAFVDTLALAHKGMIRGGYLHFWGGAPAINLELTITPDGNNLGMHAVSTWMNNGWTKPEGNALYLTFYNDATQHFMLSFVPGFPFDISYSLRIENTSAGPTSWYAELLYNVYA